MTTTPAAPDTPEMKAFSAFLAAMHDSKLDGQAMREAILWTLNALTPSAPAAIGADAMRKALMEAQAGLESAAALLPQKTDFVPSHIAALKIVNEALASAAQPPAPREPLSEQALRHMHYENGFIIFCNFDDFEQIVRAIEAAHGIKEQSDV